MRIEGFGCFRVMESIHGPVSELVVNHSNFDHFVTNSPLDKMRDAAEGMVNDLAGVRNVHNLTKRRTAAPCRTMRRRNYH